MAEERNVDPGTTLAKVLGDSLPQLRKIAPKYVNLQRLMALAIEAQQRNPLLAKASQVSVLNFCKKCAEAGTDRVGAGGMWPVPFWNNKTGSYDMTPIPDWRLLIEKAKKAKAITHASADVVREGEVFYQERGMEPTLVHKPMLGQAGKLIAAYCVYTLPDGSKDFVVMDWESEIAPIRNRSKAWQNYLKDKTKTCPWVTAEGEMGKKTAVKRAMKLFEGADPVLTMLIDADNMVNGYLDQQEAPEPIAMPRALPAPVQEPEAPPQAQAETPAETPQDGQGGPEASEPEPEAEDENPSATGTVSDVKSKTGKTAKGKAWTAFSIKLGQDWYSTFDTGIASAAETARSEGATVKITYKTNAKGYRDVEDFISFGPAKDGNP
jgi:recombination protein RecT